MFLTKYTLALAEGHLCVRMVTTDYTSPEYAVIYWPIGECSASYAKQYSFPVGAELRDLTNSSYEVKTRDDYGRVYRLKDGGQTLPIKAMEKYPCPCPKAGGKRTRWESGRWQKLLKTGWVDLPWINIP